LGRQSTRHFIPKGLVPDVILRREQISEWSNISGNINNDNGNDNNYNYNIYFRSYNFKVHLQICPTVTITVTSIPARTFCTSVCSKTGQIKIYKATALPVVVWDRNLACENTRK
jgi:hypothetical protein